MTMRYSQNPKSADLWMEADPANTDPAVLYELMEMVDLDSALFYKYGAKAVLELAKRLIEMQYFMLFDGVDDRLLVDNPLPSREDEFLIESKIRIGEGNGSKYIYAINDKSGDIITGARVVDTDQNPYFEIVIQHDEGWNTYRGPRFEPSNWLVLSIEYSKDKVKIELDDESKEYDIPESWMREPDSLSVGSGPIHRYIEAKVNYFRIFEKTRSTVGIQAEDDGRISDEYGMVNVVGVGTGRNLTIDGNII